MNVLLLISAMVLGFGSFSQANELIKTEMKDGRWVYKDAQDKPIDEELSDNEKRDAVVQACNLVLIDMGDITIGDVKGDGNVSITITVEPEKIEQECKDVQIHNESSDSGEGSWSADQDPVHDYKL